MILESHNHLTDPIKVPATRVLISYDDGTPACLVISLTAKHLRVFRAGDPDFAEQLKAHGIDRTTLVTTLDPKKLVYPS